MCAGPDWISWRAVLATAPKRSSAGTAWYGIVDLRRSCWQTGARFEVGSPISVLRSEGHMKLRREARSLKAKAMSSLRIGLEAFNGFSEDGRITKTLLH